MSALYVHFPFCHSRCIYCGFYSQTCYDMVESYVEAIIREAEAKSIPSIKTLYYGGGTPSSLPLQLLVKLTTNLFEIYGRPKEEFTMEVNPDDVTQELALAMLRMGVNRVSMGVQTFNNERLKFLHRRHNAERAIKAFNILRDAGFCNISIDLMFAFPRQTMAEWQTDLNKAISLQPEHISAYMLEIEEGTALGSMAAKKEILPLPDEQQTSLYYQMKDSLESAGYFHYEISNFAKTISPDSTSSVTRPQVQSNTFHGTPCQSHCFRSCHNSSYWDNTPYIGLGAAAHSYTGSQRLWNTANVKEYIAAINRGELPQESETITPQLALEEMILTRLRTREGIREQDLDRFPSQREQLMAKAQPFICQGLLTPTLALTREGLVLSDHIMSSLFPDN